MATDDDAQRKKPPFATAARPTGAVRVPCAKGKVPPPAVNKPRTFAFKLKKPPMTKPPVVAAAAKPTTPSTTSVSSTAKRVAVGSSGAASGALRVPVFTKKPSPSGSGAGHQVSTISAKAPFALRAGLKAVHEKGRGASGVLVQPSTTMNRAVAAKPSLPTPSSVTQTEKSTTKPVFKSLTVSGKKTDAPPSSFSRVKVSSKQQQATNRVNDGTVKAPNNTTVSRFSLKPKLSLPGPKSRSITSFPKPPVSSTKALGEADGSKKRSPSSEVIQERTPLKKTRLLENRSIASTSSEAMNVVSPEPRLLARMPSTARAFDRAQIEDQKRSTEGASRQITPNKTIGGIDLSYAPKIIEEYPQLSAFILATSKPDVFVTAEENELANFTVDKGTTEAEDILFLKRLHDLHIFVEDVAVQNRSLRSELFDSDAVTSECLMDLLTDAIALEGGVGLLSLDKLISKAQEDSDIRDTNDLDVVFPY